MRVWKLWIRSQCLQRHESLAQKRGLRLLMLFLLLLLLLFLLLFLLLLLLLLQSQ
jgi:hypothetical protein